MMSAVLKNSFIKIQHLKLLNFILTKQIGHWIFKGEFTFIKDRCIENGTYGLKKKTEITAKWHYHNKINCPNVGCFEKEKFCIMK